MFRSTLLRGASAAALTLVLVSLEASAQETLPAINIEAGAPAPGPAATPVPGPVTEKERAQQEEHAYTSNYATSATKTDVPILDTPRSVLVIPKQVLEDNQVLTTMDAVRFVSGVQPATGVFYDTFLIRGFATNFTYRNGLKTQNLEGAEDVAFIDRVEVVKGPAAMLYGRIAPGGLVDYITKKPQEVAASGIQEQFGSWGLSRTTVDSTGPLTTDKSLAYRLIGVFDHADSFVNFDHHDNGAVYGALSWKPTNQFEANFNSEYYNLTATNEGYYAQQIPVLALSYAVPGFAGRPVNVPRNWTQNDPGMYGNFPQTQTRYVAAGDWTYHFNDAWKVTNRVDWQHTDDNQEYLLDRNFNIATGELDRRVSWTIATFDTWSLNLDLNGEVNTGPVKHNLLAGFDYYSQYDLTHGANPTGLAPDTPYFNVYAPYYGNIPWPVISWEHMVAQSNVITRSKALDDGYYIQDSASYNDFIYLLLGGRYDVAFDASSQAVASSSRIPFGLSTNACFPICDGHYNPPWKGNPTERKLSPNGGLLIKITPEVSGFASYSESFSSSNAVSNSFDGTPFKPQEGKQYELGVKASLLNGKVTGSIVGFDLYLTNVLTPDPVNPGYSVATGEVRSRGVEFDLAGQVTNNINLIGSYTYDDAQIIKDNTTGTSADLGKRYLGVPRNAGNIWAKYDTAPGQKEGWIFGAGAYVNGERQGNNQNSWQLPGYVRFDTMGGYRTMFQGHPLEAQLNIQNIADAKYFDGIGSGNYAYYGAPRTFKASLKVKF